MDSYDGAEHRKIKNMKTGIVSFSSQICNATIIKEKGATPASSFNILIWQQYIGDENRSNLFPALTDVYARKRHIRENGMEKFKDGSVFFYDLHDGKMLYLSTQHSLFNRKHHPFLLCKCQRGQGLVDSEHICEPISHTEQVRFWERSKRRWDSKRSRSGAASWSMKNHVDWIDENNVGISHFVFHPNELRRDSLRFDVFHLRCSITRRLMVYLRKFMIKQTTEVMCQFSELLLTFWPEYNVLLWNISKPFASLTGSELLSFIKHTP